VGAAYRHKVKADFTGQATFTLIPTGNSQFDALVAASLPTGATPVETAIEFPALLTVGVAYDWQDWTVAADVDFHKWSSFDTLEVNFVERPDLSSRVVEAYKDSRVYRVGLERRLGERWAVRGGYFLDETPSPAESMSPLLPDADRHGLAAGFSYKSGRFRVDVASWYLIFKDRSTQGLQRDRYDGTWKSHAELLAVSLGYGF
jgi:long-chain fatty acid transport protein